MVTDRRHLTDEQQLRHDLITTVVPLRLQRDRRGHRWMQALVIRRRLRW